MAGDKTALLDLAQTLTNKTLTSPVITTPTITSPVINTGVSGTAILDEDDMATDSNTQLATQQSIKAFVTSGGVTMTNKRLTSPKLNEDVSISATATDLNKVPGVVAGTQALDGLDVNGNADISGSLVIGSGTTRTVVPAGTFVGDASGNPLQSTIGLVVDSSITDSEWWAVYPTSGTPDETYTSGKVIWTALDIVPADADWIEIDILMSASDTGAAEALRSVKLYARKNGFDLTAVSDRRIKRMDYRTTAAGNGASYSQSARKVPVAAGPYFDLLWTSDAADETIEINLIGWGFNP